jgi:8-oxo-dGTP pyrophosphatase MutT (NUDIX family)
VPATYRQQVPRPPEARPGEPAPWSACPVEARASITVERLRRALAALPPVSAVPVHSAVLVPVVQRAGEATLVFIRRSEELVRDAGHVAFPGGHLEPGERAVDAALRESQEEIGLDPALVEVIGSLGVAERRQRSERVAPFVGLVTGHPRLVPDGREVAAIFEVPVTSLAVDGVSWQERWEPGASRPGVCFFAGAPGLGRDLVWGLTARVVWDLLAAVLADS